MGLTRSTDALTLSTSPTEAMTFLSEGDADTPDVVRESMDAGDGPPLHEHPWATWEVVVRGQLKVVIDDESFLAGPGDLIYTPPNAVHTFMATEPSEVIGMNWPGGFHHLYVALADIMSGPGEPDFGAMAAAAQEHGATLHGPPLAVTEALG